MQQTNGGAGRLVQRLASFSLLLHNQEAQTFENNGCDWSAEKANKRRRLEASSPFLALLPSDCQLRILPFLASDDLNEFAIVSHHCRQLRDNDSLPQIRTGTIQMGERTTMSIIEFWRYLARVRNVFKLLGHASSSQTVQGYTLLHVLSPRCSVVMQCYLMSQVSTCPTFQLTKSEKWLTLCFFLSLWPCPTSVSST